MGVGLLQTVDSYGVQDSVNLIVSQVLNQYIFVLISCKNIWAPLTPSTAKVT